MNHINEKCKVKNEKCLSACHAQAGKILTFALCTLQFAILLSGCGTAFQVGSEIQAGRSALKQGQPKAALASFQRAAELDPDYYLNFSLLNQGVWTYMGRAHYAAGNFAEARKALERARARYDWDHLAQLYLGLTLARDGDRERGLKEIEAGLRGVGDWLENIHYQIYDGKFWDSGGNIRDEIESSLATIRGRDMDLKQLITSAEWVGREMEDEIERVVRERMRESRDDDKGQDKGND